MFKEDVTRRFDGHLRRIFATKPEILKFLLTHERKAKCLDNLCFQISMAELGTIKIDARRYDRMILEVAKMFAGAALDARKVELQSAAERARRARVGQDEKELEQTLREDTDHWHRTGQAPPDDPDPFFATRKTPANVSRIRAGKTRQARAPGSGSQADPPSPPAADETKE